jgi:hypothetical protein
MTLRGSNPSRVTAKPAKPRSSGGARSSGLSRSIGKGAGPGPHEQRVGQLAEDVLIEASNRFSEFPYWRDALESVLNDKQWVEAWYAQYERGRAG